MATIPKPRPPWVTLPVRTYPPLDAAVRRTFAGKPMVVRAEFPAVFGDV